MELFKKIEQAIKLINPNAHYIIRENDLDKITWDDDTTPISKSDIETKMAEVQTAYDNNEYQRNRATDYPSVKDQLDKIYHEGIDEWKKLIKVTKDKYPKE